jgi:hypothetical protein
MMDLNPEVRIFESKWSRGFLSIFDLLLNSESFSDLPQNSGATRNFRDNLKQFFRTFRIYYVSL